MTFDPMMPGWLLIFLTIMLVVGCVVALAQAPRRARVWWLGRILLVLALATALARPGVGTLAADAANTELDVVFVVDLSPSAVAEDWGSVEPRIDGMRADVAALAMTHAGARFALITFDDQAVQRLPLTTDASALDHAMRITKPGSSVNGGGSSIGAAADLLHEMLDTAAERVPERMRIVYYLGDGEQTARGEPDSYEQSAELIQGGAVLGYGTSQGGRMRDTDPYRGGDYIRDKSGSQARSVIDEVALEQIASELKVNYQHRTADTEVEAAKVDPTRGEGADGRSGVMTFPLYWIAALVMIAWLLVETARLVATAAQLRHARRRLDA
ncbi:VWA domain-containing protein [Gulosibacter macacae]|nr:vWA domain-containing protein [Gulosibacter macacae]